MKRTHGSTAPGLARSERGTTTPHQRRRTVRAAALLLAATAMSGCAGGPRPSPLPPWQDGVAGVVVLVDDTGLPDQAADGGWVVTVPADRLGDLLDRAGGGGTADRPREADLSYLTFPFDAATAVSWGGEVAQVDGRGRFTLTSSGETVVCRLVEGTRGTVTRGCAPATLPARGTARATWGEGGFHVSVLEG